MVERRHRRLGLEAPCWRLSRRTADHAHWEADICCRSEHMPPTLLVSM